jgi:hypothetical protein
MTPWLGTLPVGVWLYLDRLSQKTFQPGARVKIAQSAIIPNLA